MNNKYIDFTGSALVNAGKEWNLLQQSISYNRCASIAANAFLNGLIKSGLPVDQAFNVYTSKAFRQKLDWSLEDNIEKVAFKAGKEVGSEYKKLYNKNKAQYNWMNEELDISTQNEIEKRLQYSSYESK